MKIGHVYISLADTDYTNVSVVLDDGSAKVEFQPIFSKEFKDALRRDIEQQARVKFGIAATEGLLEAPKASGAPKAPKAPRTFDNDVDPF